MKQNVFLSLLHFINKTNKYINTFVFLVFTMDTRYLGLTDAEKPLCLNLCAY